MADRKNFGLVSYYKAALSLRILSFFLPPCGKFEYRQDNFKRPVEITRLVRQLLSKGLSIPTDSDNFILHKALFLQDRDIKHNKKQY